jgi:hypothetical protein
MGWEPGFSEHAEETIRSAGPRAVLIFPHTSYYEFFLYLFYRGGNDLLRQRCRILVAPMHTKNFQWLLKHVGSIPATPRDERNGGGTARIIAQLEELDEWLLVLSPKGSMDPQHPWRRGFYGIAKHFGCPIIPGGFDFQKKAFIIKEPFWVGPEGRAGKGKGKEGWAGLTFKEACAKGKAELYDIVPCHPDKSEYPITPLYDPDKLGLMSTPRWVAFWLGVAALVVIAALLCWLGWRAWRGWGTTVALD